MAAKIKVITFALLTSCVSSFYAQGDTSDNLFYFGQSYGSESQFGGLNVFANSGFVISGRFATPYIFDDLDYSKNFTVVLKSFTSQQSAINQSGGNGRLMQEFNPFDSSGRFWPNVGLHFIGEGMLSRKLEEYYSAQGYSYPKLAAITTVVASQLMNESAEVDMPWYDPVDSMADIYWNIAGLVAFSYDNFARHFSNDSVHLYYWPGQPVLDVKDGAIYNQGESYLLRVGQSKLKFALVMGLPLNGVGASYNFNGGDNLTFILGTDYALPHTHWQQPIEHDNESANDVIFDLAIPSLQLHWDRNGSLMASMIIGETTQCSDGQRSFANAKGKETCSNPSAKLVNRSHFSLNVYPLELGWATIGGYLIYSKAGANSIGITFNYPPVTIGRRYD